VVSNVINTIVGTGVEDPLNDDGPGAVANLAFPVGQSAQPGGRIALSPDDRYLYIADTNHHRIRRVDLASADLHITTIAGTGTPGYDGDGGAATAAELNSPVDVETDPAGNVYVADRDNSAIRRIDVTTGVISTIAGDGAQGYSGDGGPATKARLFSPSGLCLVSSGPQAGRIYVADTYNSVLRVIWE
jgi:sugar lactone lactonase YvrE